MSDQTEPLDITGLNIWWSVAMDLAVTKKQSADATVIQPFGVDWQGNLYLPRPRHLRDETPEIIEEILDVCEQYLPKNETPTIQCFIEKGPITQAVLPMLTPRIIERELAVQVTPVHMPGDKQAKARVLQARMQLGRVFFEDCPFFESVWLPEFLGFGAGAKHDDLVDAAAMAAYVIEMGIIPSPPEVREERDLNAVDGGWTYEEMLKRCKPRDQERRSHVPDYIDGRKRVSRDPKEKRERGLFFTEEDIDGDES